MKILGFSGYKEGGKDDSCDFLVRNAVELFSSTVEFYSNSKVIDTPKVGKFYYADDLKRLCVDILGLDERHVYGSNADKDKPSGLRWENMPGVITTKTANWYYDHYERGNGSGIDFKDAGFTVHDEGEMTVREVLQFVGTEIFRKMYTNVWVDAFMRRVRKSGVKFAFVSDVRFPNEVEAIQREGGKVIRLTRDVHKGKDKHESERALDRDRYDWNNFDAVIDNENMTRGEKYNEILNKLIEWRWVNRKDFKLGD